MNLIRGSMVALGVLLTVAACGDTAGPGAAAAAGTYALAAVSDPRGATSGTITLSSDGEAVRRVRYSLGGQLSDEYVSHGSFAPRADGTIALALRENNGGSPYIWRPNARLAGDSLTLTYEHPADGIVVETYVRP